MNKERSTGPTPELCLFWAQQKWIGFKDENGRVLIGFDKDGKHIWR